MEDGVKNGTITPERLDEAVMRILATKAALKLPEKKENGTLLPNVEEAKKVVGCKEHKEIELQTADCSPTLVKNLQGIVPIDVNKYKRILLYPMFTGDNAYMGGGNENIEKIKEAFEKEGFEVSVYQPAESFQEGFSVSHLDMVDKYDLLVYVANLITKSNQTTVRIEWAQPMGANCPNFQAAIPTIFISFANPYHLLDAPRIRTFVNAYKLKDSTLKAVIDKLLGRSEFKGISPVDPFVGRWDTRL
jgi:beta-N-acetylhexosaminidase